MRVLVDTSVWSLALRRSPPADHEAVELLADLVRDGRVEMLGAIRQELLSGHRSQVTFGRLKERLRAFPDLVMTTEDYELAAECFNRCRQQGIQGSNTDFLLCAAASRRDLTILTTDRDFQRFAEHLPIRLVARD